MTDEICYQPPVGYLDQFYMYVWDAFQNNAAEGANAINQTVQITGGYDFVLRRVVGLDSVLDPTGQFRMRTQNAANTSNAPVTCGTALRDFLVVPELPYPQTSQIAFDLYNVKKRFAFGQPGACGPTNVKIYQSQIGFSGVRRRRSGPMPTPGRFRRIPFQAQLTLQVYPQAQVVAAPGGSAFGPQSVGNVITAYLPISNYDVEIHSMQFIDVNPDDVAPGPGTIPSGLNWFAVIPYDAALNQLTSGYVLSQFLSDAVPFGTPSAGSVSSLQDPTLTSPILYHSGAMVPPLLYPKETNLKIDAVSLVGNYETTYDWDTGGNLVVNVTGFQRIPC